MEEWKEYKIGDLGRIVTGKTPKTSIKENYGGNIPFLTPSDDLSNKYAPNTNKKITELGLDEVKNCLLPPNSICVSCIGSDLGKVVMLREPSVTNQQFNSIIPNDEFCPDYIYYLMTIVGKELNFIGKTSTAVPIVNKSSFSNTEVKVPSFPTQQKIANILSSLDDKIEVNRRINEQLEELAGALFKSWFVDFEPFKDGEFVESELVKLGSVINTTSGGTPSRKHMEYYGGNHGWVKSKELNGTFIIDTEETITDDAIAKSSAKLLPEKSILIAMYGATVGQYAVLSKPMTCNQAVCALLPNDDYPYTFLFMFAKNKKDELINKAVGSAQQNISQILIKDLDISNDTKKIKEYHKIVGPAFEIILKKQQEIAHLTTLRDTLLPKLMSGEIDVNEVKI